MTFQHVEFNFGNSPYRNPPTGSFQSFNEAGKMTAEEKRIIPRLVILEQLRQEQLEESDAPQCQICFDQPPCVEVLPCKHREFCADCAIQFEKCPLCRAPIQFRIKFNPNDMEDDGEREAESHGSISGD